MMPKKKMIRIQMAQIKEIVNRLVIIAVILGIAVIAIYYIMWIYFKIKMSPLLYYSLLIEISAMSFKLIDNYNGKFIKSLLLFNSLSCFLMSCTLIYYHLSAGLFKTLPFLSFGLGLIITAIYFIYIVVKQRTHDIKQF